MLIGFSQYEGDGDSFSGSAKPEPFGRQRAACFLKRQASDKERKVFDAIRTADTDGGRPDPASL
ncbi:MAG: hypothetical protein ABR903_10280 [Thermodesulfovibrionales bacterium]